MDELRHTYRDALRELDSQLLAALELVDSQLARALTALSDRDCELAMIVVGTDGEVNRIYRTLQATILGLLARHLDIVASA